MLIFGGVCGGLGGNFLLYGHEKWQILESLKIVFVTGAIL